MDPISAIGAVSSILGIIDVVSKGIMTLSDLRSRYKIADLKVSLLIGQLSTLRAALNQISVLLDNGSQRPQDEQLKQDLSTSLACIEVVIVVLDERLSLLQRNAENGLTTWSKMNFVWDESTMKDYLSLIDSQINASNLLLTALQCNATFEQRRILNAAEHREIFIRVKDDTSSLLFLKDAESTRTSTSTISQNLGAINTTFSFDPEIFGSRVYRMATRPNMLRVLMTDDTQSNLQDPFKAQEATPTTKGTVQPTSLATRRELGGLGDARQVTAPPRLGERRMLPQSERLDIRVAHEVHRRSELGPLSQSPGQAQLSNTAFSTQPGSNAIISKVVTNTRIYQPTGTVWDTQTRPSPTNATFGDSYHVSKDTDSDLWSLHTTENQLPYELPEPLRGAQRLPSVARPSKVTFGKRKQGVQFHKVLLLGIQGSGKTTLINSMDSAYGALGYEERWRLLHIDNIIEGILTSLDQLASAIGWMQPTSQPRVGEYMSTCEKASVLQDRLQILRRGLCSEQAITAIESFWDDDMVKELYHKELSSTYKTNCRDRFRLDHIEHFLYSSRRILQPSYIPSIEDILRSYTQTTGIHEYVYNFDDIGYRFVDVGGSRSERKKWLHAFPNTHIVVYTVDVSGYDRCLLEDEDNTRLNESFILWESLVNSHWFEKTHFIVLLTKLDHLTGDRLQCSPFKAAYPDFNKNPLSVDDVVAYVTSRMRGLLHGSNAQGQKVNFFRAPLITVAGTELSEVVMNVVLSVTSSFGTR